MTPPFRTGTSSGGRTQAQDSTRQLLALSLIPGLNPRAVRALLERGPLAEAVAHPDDHADLIPAAGRALLLGGRAFERADLEAAAAFRLGIGLVALGDPRYPVLLRRISDPPPILYVRGSLTEEDDAPAVAIVGSRAATGAGRTLARAMARDLASWGATVVSGLARGIDTAAHEGALDAPGRTVAVLGCGLDRTYPAENERLAARIAQGGAVVSEFALGTPPLPDHFPRRNRVIAGWSQVVVVVEAAARSGALNTARCAADEGRDVLAVPGHPTQPASAGTNQLIRDGAGLVRSAVDVAQELGIEPAAATPRGTDPLLGALLADAPASLEELRARSGLETGDLLARLTELELRDVVRRLPGPLFVRQH
jgi:DNA processing protein